MAIPCNLLEFIDSVYFMDQTHVSALLEFDESVPEYEQQLKKLALNYAVKHPINCEGIESIYTLIVIDKVGGDQIPYEVQSQFLWLFIDLFVTNDHITRVDNGVNRFKEIVKENSEDKYIAFGYALGIYGKRASHVLLYDSNEKAILAELDEILSKHEYDEYYSIRLEFFRVSFLRAFYKFVDIKSSLKYLPKIGELACKSRSMDFLKITIWVLKNYIRNYIDETESFTTIVNDVLDEILKEKDITDVNLNPYFRSIQYAFKKELGEIRKNGSFFGY